MHNQSTVYVNKLKNKKILRICYIENEIKEININNRLTINLNMNIL